MWLDKNQKQDIFLFCTQFKPILKPKLPHIQWMPRSLSARVRQSECEADEARPFNMKVKVKIITLEQGAGIFDSVSGPVTFFPCVVSFLYVIKGYTKPVHTYSLTPLTRVLLEKLTGSAASQEIPRIFGTRKFLTVFTSARHLSLSWANSIQSPQPPPTSWRSILIVK